MDLFFVGGMSEAARDFGPYLLAPCISLLAPYRIASGGDNERGEAAVVVAEDGGLVDEW